jgi:hypothetical protein
MLFQVRRCSCEVVKCCVLLERRVIDQYIELAKRFDNLVYRRFAELRIRDVAGNQHAPAFFPFHRAFGFFGVIVLIKIDDPDVSLGWLGPRLSVSCLALRSSA